MNDAEKVWINLLQTIEEAEMKIAQNKIDEKVQIAKREQLRERKTELSKAVIKLTH